MSDELNVAGANFLKAITSFSIDQLSDIMFVINREFGSKAAEQFVAFMSSVMTSKLSATELYDVYFDKAYPHNRIRGIKFVREMTNFGLKEALDTYERGLPMFVGVTKEFVDNLDLTNHSDYTEPPHVIKVVKHKIGVRTIKDINETT